MVVKPHPNQMGCQITKCWMLEFPVVQWHKEAEKSPWQKKLARETVLIFFIGIIVFFFLEMHRNAYKCNLFPKNSEGEFRSLRRSMHDQHTFWMRGKQGRRKRPFSKTSVIRPAIYQLTCLASPVSGASFFSSSSSSWTFHEPGVKSISLHLKSKSQWPKILMEKSSW